MQNCLTCPHVTVSSLTENDIQNSLIYPAEALFSLFHDVSLASIRVNLLTFNTQLCRVANSNTITIELSRKDDNGISEARRLPIVRSSTCAVSSSFPAYSLFSLTCLQIEGPLPLDVVPTKKSLQNLDERRKCLQAHVSSNEVWMN